MERAILTLAKPRHPDTAAGNARVIAELDKRLRRLSKDDETAKRLQSMPGMGPITAAAIEAFAPPMATFKRGRDFAAWLGLVPRQHTTGGQAPTGPDVKDGTA
jgi:transposase